MYVVLFSFIPNESFPQNSANRENKKFDLGLGFSLLRTSLGCQEERGREREEKCPVKLLGEIRERKRKLWKRKRRGGGGRIKSDLTMPLSITSNVVGCNEKSLLQLPAQGVETDI